MNYYLGIDIGGTKCAVVRGDENGTVTEKVRFATTTPEETLNTIYDTTLRLIEEGKAIGESPLSIGVSCGSPMDSKRGIIQEPPNLLGWKDIHITEELTARTGLPAYLCNDANACALAEWRFGAGRGTRNMVFCTFGTGFGAGLILDGKLYAGTTDNAARKRAAGKYSPIVRYRQASGGGCTKVTCKTANHGSGRGCPHRTAIDGRLVAADRLIRLPGRITTGNGIALHRSARNKHKIILGIAAITDSTDKPG
jgi:predicted NBD/HSP70 family sugar kinase